MVYCRSTSRNIIIFSVSGHKSAFTAWIPKQRPANDTISFTNMITNTGADYKTSTGQFICYYPGFYYFTLNIFKERSTNYASCYIRKNGSKLLPAYTDPHASSDTGYYESTNSVVVHLKRGDIVDLGDCPGINNIHAYTSFTGFLLKSD